MPAFFTHYLFGRKCYARMEEGALKNMVRRHTKAFALGLSGPDIFFYFVPDQLLRGDKPGSVMHEKACGAFLHRMLEETMCLTGEDKKIAAAYLAGFVGHYELDSYCHPHVYQYIEQNAESGASGNEKTGIHFRYEGAMDYYFIKHYTGRTPSILNQNKIVRLTGREKKVICRLVAGAYNRTYSYPNLTSVSMRLVLASLRLVMFLIRDRKGRREKLLLLFEKMFFKHPFVSGLFVNDNCYGIGTDEWEEMDKLFRKALEDYAQVWTALNEVFEAEKADEEGNAALRARKEFYRRLGSRSYHTGLTV